MRKYGNYNRPLVAKTWHIYDYQVVAAPLVANGVTSLYYLVDSQLCNSLEDMSNTVGNTAMSGFPTMAAQYQFYAPSYWENVCAYEAQYQVGTTNEMQMGTYYLFSGYSDSATNIWTSALNGLTTIQTYNFEQYMRGRFQTYFAKMKKWNVTATAKAPLFRIKNHLSPKRWLGRQVFDIWDTTFSSAAGGNPVSLMYHHTALVFLRGITPVIPFKISDKVTVMSLWNEPTITVDGY